MLMSKIQMHKKDSQQALRMRRFLIGVASYCMWLILIVYCYHQGFSRLSAEWIGFAFGIVALINILLYLTFRTGLNKRFADPSLTMIQMCIAALGAMVVIYFTDKVRGVILIVYIVTIMFGVFRFNLRQYIKFTFFSVLSYIAVILLLINNHPDRINLRIELLQVVVLAAVLIWFSMIGSYLNDLRASLSTTNRNLKKALNTIHDLAILDDLTKAYNRRHLFEELKHKKGLADRGGSVFSIALLDLDRFKRINDTYGHVKGDEVLKHLIRSIRHEIREIDSISRYGGEEFIIVMDNTVIKGAEECAYRIKKAVAGLRFPGFSDAFRMTVSIGITAYKPLESIDQTIIRADKAMYRAKAEGRDRICVEYAS